MHNCSNYKIQNSTKYWLLMQLATRHRVAKMNGILITVDGK